jgi:hypothetical protein
MPSTVISSVLSFNEFFSMGVNYADVFKEDMLNIPNLLLSKEYKRSELDGTKIPQDLTKLFKDAMFDANSDLSQKLMEVLEKDNLCKGWTPRKNERITLIHNKQDGCVPYANATKMADFLEKQGFTVDRDNTDNRYVDGKVFFYSINVPPIPPKLGAHEVGALAFATEFMTAACHYLNLDEWWWKPSIDDLDGF